MTGCEPNQPDGYRQISFASTVTLPVTVEYAEDGGHIVGCFVHHPKFIFRLRDLPQDEARAILAAAQRAIEDQDAEARLDAAINREEGKSI